MPTDLPPVYDVACPYCKAEPGHRCRDMRCNWVTHTWHPHPERSEAWQFITDLTKGRKDARDYMGTR